MTSAFKLHLLAIALALSFWGLAAQSAKPAFWTEVRDEMNYRASEGTHLSVVGDQIEVTSGAVLVEPKLDTVIKTPQFIIQAKKKSLILVRVRSGCDRVFTFLGPASMLIGKQATSLVSGDEAIVTDHEPRLVDIVGEDEIGRRRVRTTTISGGKTISLTEFSLVHSIERESMLYHLVHSSEKQSKGLRDRLMKMAAALNIVTSRHGRYTTGTH